MIFTSRYEKTKPALAGFFIRTCKSDKHQINLKIKLSAH